MSTAEEVLELKEITVETDNGFYCGIAFMLDGFAQYDSDYFRVIR